MEENHRIAEAFPLPLYEYRCTQCGYSFEKIQSFSATPETVCPKCQGELIRPVTAPALQFKGAGWYVNDYAGKSKATATATAAESSSADSSSAESKPAESKSAEPAAAPAAPVPAAPAPSAS
jgi:putative FmdB family regulatory protein